MDNGSPTDKPDLRTLQKTQEGPQVVDTQSQAPETIQSGFESHKLLVESSNVAYYGHDGSPYYQNAPPSTERKSKRRPLALWLYALTVLILLAAVGIAGGVAGAAAHHQKSLYKTCQRSLDHLTAPRPPTTSPNTTSPGSTSPNSNSYISTCSSLDIWHSNLTNQNYTQVCNSDISHRGSPFTLVAGAVVDTFTTCITMCDSLNWQWAQNISLVAWSWSGNSSSGIGVNPDGQCWCVETGNQGYSMNYTLGIDCFLRQGTFDAASLGTIPER